MSVEEGSPPIPRYLVTPDAFGKDHDRATFDHVASLDRLFPRPHPHVASEAQLQKLGCPEDLISLVQMLNTPEKIQEYINTNFHYDHSDDTKGFVGVARDNSAHCFEGAIFAYTLLYVHGYNPRIVMLQADNDYGEDHNIVVYRKEDRLGSVAMSNWASLKDRPPIFPTLRDLVFGGYWHAYTSELAEYAGVWNLVGFSDPIDLVAKYGEQWLFKEGNDALWYEFQHYTDNLKCTNLFTHERYSYPPEDFSESDLEDGQER